MLLSAILLVSGVAAFSPTSSPLVASRRVLLVRRGAAALPMPPTPVAPRPPTASLSAHASPRGSAPPPLAKEDAWVASLDIDAFRRDVAALGEVWAIFASISTPPHTAHLLISTLGATTHHVPCLRRRAA
jgi:hypothetical protein